MGNRERRKKYSPRKIPKWAKKQGVRQLADLLYYPDMAGIKCGWSGTLNPIALTMSDMSSR
jgi:hypothetical protein